MLNDHCTLTHQTWWHTRKSFHLNIICCVRLMDGNWFSFSACLLHHSLFSGKHIFNWNWLWKNNGATTKSQKKKFVSLGWEMKSKQRKKSAANNLSMNRNQIQWEWAFDAFLLLRVKTNQLLIGFKLEFFIAKMKYVNVEAHENNVSESARLLLFFFLNWPKIHCCELIFYFLSPFFTVRERVIHSISHKRMEKIFHQRKEWKKKK